MADLRHRLSVVWCQRETGAPRRSTLYEQTRRLGALELLNRIRALRVEHREGGHSPRDLSRNPQCLPACGQYAQVRAGFQEGVYKARRTIEEVLAVVQHQQSALCS